jgi:hypothetical protein
LAQLGEHAGALPSDAQIWLLGLPDHIENAYAFRNAFPKAAHLLGYEQTIHVVLDVELEGFSSAEKAELVTKQHESSSSTVLLYESGGLVPSQP